MTPTDQKQDERGPLRCRQCGAPLSPDLLVDSIVCTRCGAATPIDAQQRERLAAYVGDVSTFIRDETVARYHAAFFVQNEIAALPVIAGTLGIAYALVFGIGAFQFVRHGPYVFQSHVGILMLIWVPALAAFTYGWSRIYGMPSPELMTSQSTARCASCGAMQTFSSGEAESECRYCQSTSLVPAAIASRLLSESMTQAKRSQKIKVTTLNKVQTGIDKTYVTAGVVAVVIAVPIGMVLGVWLSFVGGTPATTSELLLLMGIPLLLAGIILVRVTVRARKNYRRILMLADQLILRAGLRGQ